MPELKYKIGADPEFTILQNGIRVSASQTLRKLFKNDSRWQDISDRLDCEAGDLGCDGCDSTGELRPKPGLEPLEVTANIKQLFKEFADKTDKLDLTTLSLWAPLGGHIHLEIPEAFRGREHADKLKIKYKQMMSFYWPFVLGEHKTNLAIRLYNYGDFSEFRNDVSSRPTLELRAPSAEWLTSEEITNATLAYFSTIWHEVWDNPKNINKDILITNDEQLQALQQLTLSDFKLLTKASLTLINKNIKKFALYPKFKTEIDLILNPQKVLDKKKKVNFSILEGWGLKKPTQNKKLHLKDLLNKKTNEVDYKIEDTNIAYNGDKNCAVIAGLLAEKVTTGLTLNNNYFIYGLKNGYTTPTVRYNNSLIEAPDVNDENEKNNLSESIDKMYRKAENAFNHRPDKLTIDFTTGKIKTNKTNLIIIGIPFAERNAKRWENTLRLIHKLETNTLQLKSKDINIVETPATPTTTETTEDLLLEPDTNSQGREMALCAVSSIVSSQQRAEREQTDAIKEELHPKMLECLMSQGMGFVTSDNITGLAICKAQPYEGLQRLWAMHTFRLNNDEIYGTFDNTERPESEIVLKDYLDKVALLPETTWFNLRNDSEQANRLWEAIQQHEGNEVVEKLKILISNTRQTDQIPAELPKLSDYPSVEEWETANNLFINKRLQTVCVE